VNVSRADVGFERESESFVVRGSRSDVSGQVDSILARPNSIQTQQSRTSLISIHQDIHELKKSIKEVERRAFPFGKWTSLEEGRLPRETKSIHAFPMSRVWPPAGSIGFLTKWVGENVHQNGIITVRGNSPDKAKDLRNVVDLNTNTYYCSQYGPNQWICYDMNKMRILPRGYSIRSNANATAHHLRSWVIEATNNFDSPNWTELDRRENASDLNGSYSHACFPMSTQAVESYRYIRLRMTGPTSSKDNCLYITGLELFGELTILQ
jgi:hypothetical protein